MSNSKNEIKWSGIALRIFMNTVAHPMEYAKVLIQIGHEPLPPYPTTTLLGRRILALPNVLKYLAYVKNVDGFVGWYRGLGPKLCASTVYGITFERVHEVIRIRGGRTPEIDENTTEEERQKIFVYDLSQNVLCRTAAIIASQPFNVITVRMMAQFVGGENKYCGIFNSIKEIFHENGILGFFSGLVPRIVGEILSLIIASSLTFVINYYFLEDEELKTYTSASMNFLAGTITYPFQVVSNCMAVNDSGLIAGIPPQMPIYTSWTDCWSHLSRTNQLKRGSSILFRYYTGTQIVIQGRPIAVNKNNFLHSNS
ncbi:mitochondrial carrier homolog 2-like [Zootermopsis nevadensis]|uniref:Mitochondrial carrier-like protein 2 n=1 Tax=Zootermopsis nevadensis TaxID=136037 RepID=A0A067R4T8_ZOONE|nr:mitochondrial carrier homolog 2-like [Zootermopsis nevadensis]KDR14212.1 Mitochondrial carrier-like protein 2 [Zootermopsis nevadensis]